MTNRTTIGGAAIGLLLATLGTSDLAHAQQADVPDLAPPQQADGPPKGSGIASRDTARSTSRNEGTAAAPPGLSPGTLDLKNGFSVLLNYTGEFAANPSGGLKQGDAFAGQLAVGVDADLNKIAGINGGSVHFLLTDRQGRSLSGSDIGNDTSVQEIYGDGQTYRLTQLGYEQRLFNDRLDFEVGRLNGQGMTLTSPLYCNFQNNAVCGSPTTAFKDTNFTYYPSTTWGGHAKFWLDPDYKVFFHVGAYEVNPNSVAPYDHGFDWSTKGATGFNIPMELGYSTTPANDRLPRNYGIGAIIDESKYSDPIYTNTGALQALPPGGTPQTDFGRTAIFARFDQMIWRPDSTSLRGITVFGVGLVGTGGQQTQSFFAEGGALWTGIFPSRPYDTLGFNVSDQHYSGLGLFNLRTANAIAGNNVVFPSDQFMLELNYGIQLDPGLRVLPQLQYIVNPTQPAAPYLTKPIPNAFVLGFKFSADLLTLARLAKGPGSI